MPDFNSTILRETAHRPWPMPQMPWIMTQTWHDLLFAHWRLDPAVLRGKVPPSLPLDVYDGAAWIAIVPFHMTNVAPRGVPSLPWLSAFPELNVRTYVTIDGKPGVYFFSLDAKNPLAVRAARLLFHLPYYTAEMHVEASNDRIVYRSHRGTDRSPIAALETTYRPTGDAFKPVAGSLEHFLTERYCLYAVDRRGATHRLEIHHPPWLLQPADAEFAVNSMTAPLDLALPSDRPLLHFARRQDMVAFPMARI